MVALSMSLPLPIGPQEAGPALERLLAATRAGDVSAITVRSECLVRMIRPRKAAAALNCLITWESIDDHRCSFVGAISIAAAGPGGTLALVLDGMAQERNPYARDRHGPRSAATTGRAVLERLASELSTC